MRSDVRRLGDRGGLRLDGLGLVTLPESIDAAALLSRYWPRRFAEAWCARFAPAKKLPHFTAAELKDLAAALNAWPLHFSGTEGYPKADAWIVADPDMGSGKGSW